MSASGGAMQIHPQVHQEWRRDRCLTRQSLTWIEEHADPGDPHPIDTAIGLLRAMDD
jgi:hypothetical protein